MTRRKGILICLSMLVIVLPACGAGEGGDVPPPPSVASDTVTAPGTGRAGVPVESFSMSSCNQTAPEDVIREITYYSRGGGAGPCELVTVCDQDYRDPTVVVSPEELEAGDDVVIRVCGWQPEEWVRVTVTLPDGEETSRDVQAVADNETHAICFCYSTGLDDPPGSYTFVLEGDSGTVQQAVHIRAPTAPQLQWDADRLYLYAFQPNERVRLLAYDLARDEPDAFADVPGVLAGWQEYHVDAGGRLVIELERGYAYAVVGDISGEVLPSDALDYRDTLIPYSVEADTGDEPLDVREHAGHSQRVIKQVPSGTRMRVNRYPLVVAGNTWLPVLLGDGTEGWVPKTDIRRVREGPASCPGASPQRVRVGDRAQVCTTHDRLVLRERPGRGGTEVARLEPGTYIRVVGGPACEDGESWWQVRADFETVGWVAEGGDEVDPYYICPAR